MASPQRTGVPLRAIILSYPSFILGLSIAMMALAAIGTIFINQHPCTYDNTCDTFGFYHVRTPYLVSWIPWGIQQRFGSTYFLLAEGVILTVWAGITVFLALLDGPLKFNLSGRRERAFELLLPDAIFGWIIALVGITYSFADHTISDDVITYDSTNCPSSTLSTHGIDCLMGGRTYTLERWTCLAPKFVKALNQTTTVNQQNTLEHQCNVASTARWLTVSIFILTSLLLLSLFFRWRARNMAAQEAARKAGAQGGWVSSDAARRGPSDSEAGTLHGAGASPTDKTVELADDRVAEVHAHPKPPAQLDASPETERRPELPTHSSGPKIEMPTGAPHEVLWIDGRQWQPVPNT